MTSVTAFAPRPSRRLFLDQRLLSIVLTLDASGRWRAPARTQRPGYVSTITRCRLLPSIGLSSIRCFAVRHRVFETARDYGCWEVVLYAVYYPGLSPTLPRGSALTGAPALTFR
jgi:hypothetical protein